MICRKWPRTVLFVYFYTKHFITNAKEFVREKKWIIFNSNTCSQIRAKISLEGNWAIKVYKNIARVNILRQIHQFSGFLDRGRGIYNLHSRRKRLVCSCSAFNFNGLLILTSIQPEVKSLKFWPFCVILKISRGLRRWDALL